MASVAGIFHVYVPADVSTDFAMVFTSFPAFQSWIFTWAPGLPVDDQVIACVLPRDQEAPAVGAVTLMLLVTVRASPAKSAAAQKPEAMHDTELSPLPPPSMVTGVAHDVPFQVRAWPLRSAAVHTVDDVHDTE